MPHALIIPELVMHYSRVRKLQLDLWRDMRRWAHMFLTISWSWSRNKKIGDDFMISMTRFASKLQRANLATRRTRNNDMKWRQFGIWVQDPYMNLLPALHRPYQLMNFRYCHWSLNHFDNRIRPRRARICCCLFCFATVSNWYHVACRTNRCLHS